MPGSLSLAIHKKRWLPCLAILLSLCRTGYTQHDILGERSKDGNFSARLYGGLTFSQGDIKPMQIGNIYGCGLGYAALKFLDFNLNVQKGIIKAGTTFPEDQPEYRNNFYMAALSLRFYPIGIIETKSDDNIVAFLSQIYIGTGIGFIHSNTVSNRNTHPDWAPLGRYKGSDLYVPLEVGFLFPLLHLRNNNPVFLQAGYGLNLSLSDEIDGYTPTVSANKWRDAFSSLTLGIGLKF